MMLHIHHTCICRHGEGFLFYIYSCSFSLLAYLCFIYSSRVFLWTDSSQFGDSRQPLCLTERSTKTIAAVMQRFFLKCKEKKMVGIDSV